MKSKEEIANYVTHGIGIFLSIIGFAILMNQEYTNTPAIASIIIYGIALILLYTFSTLYHAVKNPKWKKNFQIADHSAIYIKIAGTYTPFGLITLEAYHGKELLIIIWSLALAGIIYKCLFGEKFMIVSTIIYLLMGWIAIVAVNPLLKELSSEGFQFLLAGGICYTAGVLFFLWEKLPFSHSIWHVFVLGGSIFHYFTILLYVI